MKEVDVSKLAMRIFEPEATADLERSMKQGRNADVYSAFLMGTYSRQMINAKVLVPARDLMGLHWQVMAEPFRDKTDVPGQLTASKSAFYRGELLAAEAIRLRAGFTVMNTMAEQTLWGLLGAEITELPNRDALVAKAGETIEEYGDIGHSQVPHFHESVSKYSDGLVADAQNALQLRRGFGLVMYQARVLVEAAGQEAIMEDVEQIMDGTADWDGFLRGINPDNL